MFVLEMSGMVYEDESQNYKKKYIMEWMLIPCVPEVVTHLI